MNNCDRLKGSVMHIPYPCDQCLGGGMVFDLFNDGEQITCPSCAGSGLKNKELEVK